MHRPCRYIFHNPTWPVEWLQMTPNLAWLDYQTTNSTDLFAAYEELLANNTMVNGHLDPQLSLIHI